MAVETFTITVNEVARDYQSYVSVEEAVTYYSLEDGHAFVALTEVEQQVLLVGATRRIDLAHFKGCKEDEDQFTKFPRTPYGLPYDIELATILLAEIIRTDPTASTPGGFNANIQRIRAGSVEVYFFEPDNKTLIGEEFAIEDPTIRALLRPYIAISDIKTETETIGTGGAFGTDGVSTFNSPLQDQYKRNLI